MPGTNANVVNILEGRQLEISDRYATWIENVCQLITHTMAAVV